MGIIIACGAKECDQGGPVPDFSLNEILAGRRRIKWLGLPGDIFTASEILFRSGKTAGRRIVSGVGRRFFISGRSFRAFDLPAGIVVGNSRAIPNVAKRGHKATAASLVAVSD